MKARSIFGSMILVVAFVLVFLLTPGLASAATCTAVPGLGLCTGSPSLYQGWADGSTWSGCAGNPCTGTGSGCPTTSDTVVIPSTSCVRVGITGAAAAQVTVDGQLYFGNPNLNNLGNLNVGGNFTISATGSVQPSVDGASNLYIGGNFSNNGAFSSGTSARHIDVTFDGSGAQSIGGSNATTFYNLIINNTSSDANGVSLGNNQTVNNVLTLTDGLLKVAGYNLTLGTGATISGGTSSVSMVVTDEDGTQTGRLCKTYPGNGSFTFPVGDSRGTAEYSRAVLLFSAGLANPSTVCVRVTDAVHPNYPGAQYPSYITRYWTASSSDNAFTATASFTYVDADVTLGGGQSESALYHKIWNGSAWTTGNQTNPGTNTISTQVSSFSDHTAFSGSPLAVALESFTAEAGADGVTVAWETVSEQDNAGFNVLRGETADGPWAPVNAALIPAATPGSSEGHSYTWVDPLVPAAGQTVYYLLEDVDFSGAVAQHGPVSVTAADVAAAPDAGPNAVRLSGFGAAAGTLPFALPLIGLGLAAAGAVALRRRK